MSDPIYLDHNATTPVLPEVVDAMVPYLREHFGNPSSGHVYGARARDAVSHARARVAGLIGCEPDEVLFTSGGTESNNLAIFGTLPEPGARTAIVTSVIEHPATAKVCAWFERHGATVTRLGVDTEGRVDLAQARDAITEGTSLVTVMHSNNETGVLQPIAELAALARAKNARVHTDAAQSIAKVAVDVRALGVDLLSIAGHKLYAPKGVGALYVRRGVTLSPFALGAGHERGLRPGTENVASIVGLGVACEIAARDLTQTSAAMTAKRAALWGRLQREIPGIALNGGGAERLPNTLSVRVPGASGGAVLAAAPEVAASTGSACHEGHEQASSVILAMGIAPLDALGTIRLTLGRSTTNDVERAAVALGRAWRELSRG
jgi:cysteine desulfurase